MPARCAQRGDPGWRSLEWDRRVTSCDTPAGATAERAPIVRRSEPARADTLTVIGTRPEIIKMAPVLHAVRSSVPGSHQLVVTGQQPDLTDPTLGALGVMPDIALGVSAKDDDFLGFIRHAGDAVARQLVSTRPRLVLVQGDTASAFAGALAATLAGVPLLHIEAGLRSGCADAPYPEEALRTLISHCAEIHCTPTPGNTTNLRREGVPAERIVLTGNPVVDAVQSVANTATSATVQSILSWSKGRQLLVLTCHRRENIGQRMHDYMRAARDFVAAQPDYCLFFPVHPNPHVKQAAADILSGHPRIRLEQPLAYPDFIRLLRAARLVLSDSGGLQEEVLTLNVPLIILRTVTERPEALLTGQVTLAADGAALGEQLRAFNDTQARPDEARKPHNPFGNGDSGARIAEVVRRFLAPDSA